ncbi:MAG TPA: 4Fe-4S dicluster domain-containing protein [Bacillota bacterium]
METKTTPQKKVVFDEERCKGCELCVAACPKGIIRLADHFNSKGFHPASVVDDDQAKCTTCLLCARMCPDTAIEIFRPERVAK